MERHRPFQPANASTGRLTGADEQRRQPWAERSPAQILAQYRPGQAAPLQVLEVLLTLFNSRHTALHKTVSHKTRQERADFLRRFFRDLSAKAGFGTAPDPRNLGQKHMHAMVQVWQREQLAPATIQTYLSSPFRKFAHVFVRLPASKAGSEPSDHACGRSRH